MNEQAVTSKIPQPKLLSVLEFQHELDCRIESKIKDLAEINNRIDNIANRLNSTDYGKNHNISKEPNANLMNRLADKPTSPDGLVGELIALNVRSEKRVEELQNVISSIFVGLTYLETHI